MTTLTPTGGDDTSLINSYFAGNNYGELYGTFRTSGTITLPANRTISGNWTLISTAPFAFEVVGREVNVSGGVIWASAGGFLVGNPGGALRFTGKLNSEGHAFTLTGGSGLWLLPGTHLNASNPANNPHGILCTGDWDTIIIDGVLMEEYYTGMYLTGGPNGSIANVVATNWTVDRCHIGAWIKPTGTRFAQTVILEGCNFIGRTTGGQMPVLLNASETTGYIKNVRISGVATRFTNKSVPCYGIVYNTSFDLLHD